MRNAEEEMARRRSQVMRVAEEVAEEDEGEH